MLPSEAEIERRRPTLASSCAQASTADEARFRLQYPRATQSSRVIALDEPSGPLVCKLASRSWMGDARFLTYEGLAAANGDAADGRPADAMLRECDGDETRLQAQLDDAELVIMIASTDDSAAAAEMVGDVCAERRIMTTGLVLAEWGALDATVSRLRPNAMVMVVSPDEEDLVGILTALRV